MEFWIFHLNLGYSQCTLLPPWSKGLEFADSGISWGVFQLNGGGAEALPQGRASEIHVAVTSTTVGFIWGGKTFPPPSPSASLLNRNHLK